MTLAVSCDKIRIKYRLQRPYRFAVPYEDLPEDYFADAKENKLDFYGQSGLIGRYLHSLWFRLPAWESNMICFAGQINSKCEPDFRIFVVEFNPNKHTFPPFLAAYLRKAGAFVIQILSADFCYDFHNIPVSEFIFDCVGQTQLMSFGRVGGTYARYLSPKARDGRIKIYDKEDERKGKPDAERFKGITRLEISYKDCSVLYDPDFEPDYAQLDAVDIARIKDMYYSLTRVKLPWHIGFSLEADLDYIFGDSDEPRDPDCVDLNSGHLMAIMSFLRAGEPERAKEYVKRCFKSKAPRVKYNGFIRKYNGFYRLYEDCGAEVPFYYDLCDCVRKAIPVLY